MKYAFFGSPRFAALVLEELLDKGFAPAALVANPDRPVSRKQILTPPSTKELLARRVPAAPIFQPDDPLTIVAELKALECDVFIVAAYAKILPHAVISLPRLGTLGVHPSLLPRHRGSSPIQAAILEGDATTGISIYQLDEKMDHGPILGVESLPVKETDTYLTLEERLARMGGRLLAETLPRLLQGNVSAKEQDHVQATFTKKFKTEDGLVMPGKEAPITIARKIRAFTPEPGAFALSGEERVKYLAVTRENDAYIVTKIHRAGKKPEAARIVLPPVSG